MNLIDLKNEEYIFKKIDLNTICKSLRQNLYIFNYFLKFKEK